MCHEGKKDGVDEVYAFRNGVTSKLKDLPQSPCHPVTRQDNNKALCLPGQTCAQLTKAMKYARVQSTDRCQHLCMQEPDEKAKKAKHEWFAKPETWPQAVKAEFQNAFRSDLNELLVGKAFYEIFSKQKGEIASMGCLVNFDDAKARSEFRHVKAFCDP
jgi:hypothetical protein